MASAGFLQRAAQTRGRYFTTAISLAGKSFALSINLSRIAIDAYAALLDRPLQFKRNGIVGCSISLFPPFPHFVTKCRKSNFVRGTCGTTRRPASTRRNGSRRFRGGLTPTGFVAAQSRRLHPRPSPSPYTGQRQCRTGSFVPAELTFVPVCIKNRQLPRKKISPRPRHNAVFFACWPAWPPPSA
jgi:hypothetical protein